MNKYEYLIIGQGHYGQGWEDETEYPDTPEGRKEARADLKSYQENSSYPFRIRRRRVARLYWSETLKKNVTIPEESNGGLKNEC